MERVAVVGLGRMGRRIASRLAQAGLEVTVHDIEPGKADGVQARVAGSAKDAAARAGAEGRVAKLAVDGLLACSQASLAEGLVLGERAGLDRELLLEVFAGSSMVSPALRGAIQTMRERTFEPRLTTRLLAKDLRLLV